MSAVQAAEDPAKREESLGYNKAAQKTIDASAAESFAGRYAPAKVGFLARLLFKAKQQQPQDYLDPDMIRSWAGSILVGLPF